MRDNIGAALLLFGFALLGIARAQYSGAQCRNGIGEIGLCINLKECTPLLSILTAQPRNPAGIQFLQRSQCGFEGRDPLVCCSQGNGIPVPTNPVPNYPPNYPPTNPAVPGGTSINPNADQPVTDRFSNHPTGTGTGTGTDIANHPNIKLLPTECGRDLSNRIIGGNVTEIDEYTWMALLVYRKPTGKTTACGGALANKRYVVTAAHCLKGKALPRTWHLEAVRLGEYNTGTKQDCIPDGVDSTICADEPVTVDIEEKIVHEDYDPNSPDQKNDIALLRLSRDVEFTNYINPICLPMTPEISAKFVVAGWGKTETSSGSDVKLKVSVPLVDKEACKQKYSGEKINLGPTQICAGGKEGKDSCRGDSGGPLMQRLQLTDGTTKWTQAGVVSFGPTPCGMKDWPGVYTKLYDFMPWILNKIKP